MTRPIVPPKKALGQHFLHDQLVLGRIAELATPHAGSGIVEIGAGTGNLTAHLLAHFPYVVGQLPPLTLLEIDPRTPAVLAARFAHRAVDATGAFCRLAMGDAAHADWNAILWQQDLGPAPIVVGNLPYYAAMPILFALLDLARPPSRIVIMVQKEVAERLVAAPSTPQIGQISVKVQLRAAVRIAFKVGRGAFQPPPNVDSAVIVIEPRATPAFALPPWPAMSRLITAGFAVRRKTLVNALGQAGYAAPAVIAALAAVGADSRIRAEALTLTQWARIGLALSPSKGPGTKTAPGEAL